MRTLNLTLVVLVVAGGVVAPAALAKHKKCPPGSGAQEYCQVDPPYPWHHGDRHHRHHGHDDARGDRASLGHEPS